MLHLTNIQRDTPLKTGSTITFYLSDGTTYKGEVRGRGIYYIYMSEKSNSIIFTKLGIADKNQFVSEVIGHDLRWGGLGANGWPEIDSFEELEKILDALLKVNKPLSTNSHSTTLKIKTNKSVKLNYKL